MIIAVCGTRNMYAQMVGSINMLLKTQPEIEHIYAFTEDEINSDLDKVTFINVSKFEPLISNANVKNYWSYISMTRCYFTKLLPDVHKILYLDLDLMITSSLKELWETDMTNYSVAGVIDTGVKAHQLLYLPDDEKYINSGVLLMNLDYIREHNLDLEIWSMLSKWPLRFPDQDAINIVCYGSILYLDSKWNSSYATSISEDAVINHCIKPKPWDPNSKWFDKWVVYYYANR